VQKIVHSKFLMMMPARRFLDLHLHWTLLSPSSETQGQLVGAGKNTGEEKSRTRERAPGDKVLTEQFQTVRVALAFDWCQKTFVFFCLIKEQED